MPRRSPLVLALFFGSGAAGLLYEVVWTRVLTLTFGATASSLAAVLCAYMAGLALGSALLSWLAPRPRFPLRLYGLLELGVALAALTVRPLLARSMPWLHSIYGGIDGPSAGFQLGRFGLALAILLVPTVLMGATLPVLTDALTAEKEHAGVQAGRAYGVNTLGAMVGAGLAGFVLIRWLGMRHTEQLAVALNVAAGAIALGLSRSRAAAPRPTDPTEAGAESPPRSVGAQTDPANESRGDEGAPSLGAVAAICGLAGFCSLSYELLWTRFFINSFHGTVAAFSTILIAYLGGLGLGAIGAAWLSRRQAISLLQVGTTQAAVALLAVLMVGNLSTLPQWLQTLVGRGGSFQEAIALLTAAILLPPTLLMGMTLPLAVQLLRRRGVVAHTVGRLYAASSIGSALGPALTAFVVLPALGAYRATLATALLQAVVALVAVLADRAPAGRRWPAVSLAAGAIFVAGGVWIGHVHGARVLPVPLALSPERNSVLLYDESPHGTVVVSRDVSSGTRTLFIDGFAATSDGIGTDYMRLMGHLPMLVEGERASALVICLGTGITLGSVASHQPAQQDCVELNPKVVPAARLFAAENGSVLDSPRTHLVLDDGRDYLEMTDRRYDVITLEPLPPFFAGTVSLYTRELDQLARRRLRPGGVFAQWLPFHLVSDLDARMIVRAVADVFPHVVVWKIPGDLSGIILASERPLHFSDAALSAHPEVHASMAALGYADAAALEAGVVLPDGMADRYAAGARAVTDDWPSLEYRAWFDDLEVTRARAQANIRGLRRAAGFPEDEPPNPRGR